MINASDVTACLVTRGDQLQAVNRIRRGMIFTNVVIWDNSRQLEDWKCAGRYKAAEKAPTDVVYFQDDDVIVPETTQWELLQAYEPGVCVAVWGHGENPDGYDDLPLVCGGAIVDRQLCFDAIERYAEHWPLDDAYRYEADFVVGALYPAFKHLDLPFYIDMKIAQAPERLVNQPWQKELKYEITQRARAIRDMAVAA